MLFVEAEDKRNKHFSIAEASLTIEVRRSAGGLTGTKNTAEPRHFRHSIKTSEEQTTDSYTLAKRRLNGTTLVRLTNRMATIRTDFLPKS